MKKIGLVCSMLFLFAITACSSTGASVSQKEAVKAGGTETPAAVQTVVSTDKAVDMIRIGWANSGFPSPFTFSKSGPGGFLRNTFLFDSLTWKDESGVIPWLAAKWDVSKDGLTYTFTIRDGVTFHDGKPLTANDVKFSYEYFKKFPFGWKSDLSMIEKVEIKGNSNVIFTLKTAFNPFISEVAGIIPILPEHIWSSVKDPLKYRDKEALIGSGPYLLESYEQEKGQYLFKANASYFLGKPRVEKVAYIPETGGLAVKNGKIDVGMTSNYNEAKEVEKLGFKLIQSKPTGSAVRLVFNLEHKDLKQKELRQAIAYALNRSEIAEKSTGGNPIVGSAGVIPPDSPWYNSNVKQYDHNTEKANSLLDQLGYAKNADQKREKLKLKLLLSTSPNEAKLVQSMLEKVGIGVELQTVDAATFASLMGENNYDIALTGHIGLSGDPDFLNVWFSGQATNSLAARGKVFENKEFKELAQKEKETSDEKERKQAINGMQDILAEELPTLILFHRPFYWMHKSEQFNGWFNTSGGIADGIPLWDNKVAFLNVKKK